jgi:hypothetical protein
MYIFWHLTADIKASLCVCDREIQTDREPCGRFRNSVTFSTNNILVAFPCTDIYLHGFTLEEREAGKGRRMTIRRANRRDKDRNTEEATQENKRTNVYKRLRSYYSGLQYNLRQAIKISSSDHKFGHEFVSAGRGREDDATTVRRLTCSHRKYVIQRPNTYVKCLMLCNSAILCQDCSWFSCFPLERSRRRTSLSGSDHFRPYPFQFMPSLDALAQWLSGICCPRLSLGHSLFCLALELQYRYDHSKGRNIILESLCKCIYYFRKPR